MTERVPTSSYSHFSEKYKDQVYEPYEDSFALIDAIEADIQDIRGMSPCVIAEVGCGSGVVLRSCSQVLKNNYYIFSDISHSALLCSVDDFRELEDPPIAEFIRMDLLSCIEPGVSGVFDVILFNPPYVPSSPISSSDLNHISLSWKGGIDGVEVMMRFISDLPRVMRKPNGRCYLVAIEANVTENLMSAIKHLCLTTRIVVKRKTTYELIYVMRVSWH